MFETGSTVLERLMLLSLLAVSDDIHFYRFLTCDERKLVIA